MLTAGSDLTGLVLLHKMAGPTSAIPACTLLLLLLLLCILVLLLLILLLLFFIWLCCWRVNYVTQLLPHLV